MKILKALDLKFSDPNMEREYLDIRKKYKLRDFQVTTIAIMLVTLVVSVERIIKNDLTEFTITTSTLGGLVLIFLFQIFPFFRKYVDYLTLIVILAYNIYRLIILKTVYASLLKINLFFSGYTYAILHMIMISRVPGIFYKICAVVSMYILRFGFIMGDLDQASLQAGSLVRGVIVDAFILYYYYINDKTDREVFQNFFENREELLKFKELLADFPQSVTVADFYTKKFLFSNSNFSTTFEPDHVSLETPPNHTNLSLIGPSPRGETTALKPSFSFLRVDRSTIREIGSSQSIFHGTNVVSESTYLNDFMENLIKDNALEGKAVSLTAFYTSQEQRKSFEVILKRVKWNRVDAIAIILNDITYQENLIALKSAILNKDQIIATVSHELRTPLNGILGLLEMTEKRVSHPEALKYLSLSKDSAHLLLSLVNSHLDLQQIRAGKLRLNPSRVNLAKVLNDVTQLLQFQTSQKGIYLEYKISGGVPRYITTDENRFKQILINLIGNAIKFTYKGGITIDISQDPQEARYLKVSVIDTGIGIKEEDIGKLFQNYARLEEGRNLNKSGVGLGLTISSALALILGNRINQKGIEVMSKHGVGSNFSFRIVKDLKESYESEDGKEGRDNVPGELEEQQQNIIEINNKHVIKNPPIVFSKESDHEAKEILSDDYEEESGILTISSKLATYVKRLNKAPRFSGSFNLAGLPLEVRNTEGPLVSNNMTNGSHGQLKEVMEVEDMRAKLLDSTELQQTVQRNYILVVDDNSFNLLVTGNILKELGYEVKTAMGGREAIQIMKDYTREGKIFKAVLMDCLMPEIDGYETSKILKEMMNRKEIQKVPILALTANSIDEIETKKCCECGMEGCLTKPLSPEVLRKTFSKLE